MNAVNPIEIDQLIQRVKTEDASAFTEIFDRYSAALNGVVRRFFTDEEIAADVLQDSFIKIWKNIHFYDDSKGSFYTWMLNITRNTSIDWLRKLKKHPSREIQSSDDTVVASVSSSISTSTIGLKQLVDKLPEEQRIIIEYLYFKGYTQQEVSDELNLPLGTVKTRTRIALRELRKWFSIFLLWM